MPSSLGTRRRYSKQSSSSKKSTPSSALSTISGSSTSSNATVTSGSIFPSSLRPSKRPESSKPLPQTPIKENGRSRSMDDSYKGNLNVFAFMEDDEDEEYISGTGQSKDEHDEQHEMGSSSSGSARLTDPPQRSPRYSDLEVRAIQDGVQRVWARESLHSDSGISDMRSSSPDQDSPVMHHKLPTLMDVSSAEVDGQDAQYSYEGAYGIQSSPDLSGHRNSVFHHQHWPSMETNHVQSPEPYFVQPPRHMIDGAYHMIPETYSRPTNSLVRGTSQELTTRNRSHKAGYELLASNIDSRDDALLKPIYRKFETLNNRMLLFLQDEISEMEDQLRELDDAIAHEGQVYGENPASRRAEAKLPSQLQWHRLDLLGRSFAKVEQYNRALTSYSALTSSLSPASHSDIVAYRSWISAHSPLVEPEAAFIHQEESDLLAVQPHSSSTPSPSHMSKSTTRAGTALETPIVVVAFALLSTVVVFKVVPQILGRLVVSAMVGVAALCTLSPEMMRDLKGFREWGSVIATYSAIMLVLAIVVN